MKLKEILLILQNIQKKIGSSPVSICGGAARDKYMNTLKNIADLDLTSGDGTIDYTSQEFFIELRKKYNVTRKVLTDHSTVFIGNLKMDFSSNFMVHNIDNILQQMGIKTPTNMQREMFSRDFTCNALLMRLDLKTISDPTGRGFKDIADRKIRTCLAPEITLTSNRNRVIRAIYLACKLDFDIDDSIINYVSMHPQTVKISTEKSMIEKLNEAFTKNGEKAAALITKMNLWSYVPISEKAYPYYQRHLQGKPNVAK